MSSQTKVSPSAFFGAKIIHPTSDVKIADVKKRLLAEEYANVTKAGADTSLMQVTATSLIIVALEIEDLQ
jgi:hypothetical protein